MLFDDPPRDVRLGEGAVVLGGFARSVADDLLAAIATVAAKAPFRHMKTPGGQPLSAAMTSCGELGWISDRKGYRYVELDPDTRRRWPPMPPVFADLASRAATQAGFPVFDPDACLVNRYEPGARMALHQDKDEQDFAAPIVSVSLGLPATFLFGGLERSGPAARVPLTHGDVVVWGGPSRLAFHGVMPLAEGAHLSTGRLRFNLTLRRASP